MLGKREWKLASPPETAVAVDSDVLAMRVPLVRVYRDEGGAWFFDGPGEVPRPATTTTLAAVVGAWPHVLALSTLDIDDSAIWSWARHGWTSEIECSCGECDQPVAADIDRGTWPSELRPDRVVSVENTALSGQEPLTDILSTPGGIALLAAGGHHRTSDQMAPVALANVIRRWPHTMQALRTLKPNRGMRWNSEELNWGEYATA